MDLITLITIWLPVFMISLTIHELCHGLSAYYLGDDTAKRAGRLTLNPIAHIDPIGIIMLFIIHIGWAKPVPVNPYNFRNVKRDMAITAAAGPASNFVLAVIMAIIFNFVFKSTTQPTDFLIYLHQLLSVAILINLALGFFNLIPLPPLDGSKILGGFMTDEQYYKYLAFEKQGTKIFMIVILASYFFDLDIIGRIIFNPAKWCFKLLTGVEIL